MFDTLREIFTRPAPFGVYTAPELWADEHTSEKMLQYHLNPEIDLASRKHVFIERSAEWIAATFGVNTTTSIADFGCGPGLYTTALAERGARVTGIDFSSRSLRYAAKRAVEKGLQIRYVQQNYLDLETEDRFDLILLIMCDFCALSPEQRHGLVRKFTTLLNPGGAVLLDAYTLNTFALREETIRCEKNLLHGFWSRQDYYGFLNVFKYEREKVVLDKYTIVEPSRTRVIYNWLQYFSPETLTQELESGGLVVEHRLSDVAGTPFSETSQEMAIIARKP